MNERSKKLRRDTIALSKANGGYHYGGSFSIVEILIALYDHVLNPEDRFILSKGHACWPWYVILRELGFNPELTGHPERDPKNGVYCTSGSLGHGLPTGLGIALSRKIKGLDGHVFVLMGDGECQEGTTWESMLIAGHHKLDNLTMIVDWNKIQGSGFVDDILPIKPLCNIAEMLGWDVYIVNGHAVGDICTALHAQPEEDNPKPKLILASTTKGKGVSFMENDPAHHAHWLTPDEEDQALEELI